MRVLNILLIILFLFQSCKKKELIGEDPYAGGKEALSLKFKSGNPSPTSGKPGDIILFKATGLEQYRDKLTFLMNEQEVEIVSMTDSTIQVIVPPNVSSGGVSIVVDGEVIFGPNFNIEGKLAVNNSFNLSTGFYYQFGLLGGIRSKGFVFDYLDLSPSSTLFVGSFTDYNTLATSQVPINAIVNLNTVGAIIPGSPTFGKGVSDGGLLRSVLRMSDGNLIVSGSFGRFQDNRFMYNITRLKPSGILDTMTIRLVNDTEDPLRSIDTVPLFNGGVNGTINKSFLVTHAGEEKIVSIGNFTNYMKIRYDARPTYDSKNVEVINIENIIRFDKDGGLDKSYNFDINTNKGLTPPNGFIIDAAQEENGNVIVVGRFTRFQGKTTNNIARLDANGHVDETFNVGTGANGQINSIQRANGKILLVGSFTRFNNTEVNGVVMLNLDGSVDPTFSFKSTTGGKPQFAKLLSTGKIIVSGAFEKYDNVKRSGFLILESDGTALQDYNNIGTFDGAITNVKETTIASRYTLLLMGYIRRFDSKDVAGMVAVEIKN